jgi:hypothetical protein
MPSLVAIYPGTNRFVTGWGGAGVEDVDYYINIYLIKYKINIHTVYAVNVCVNELICAVWVTHRRFTLPNTGVKVHLYLHNAY